MIKNLADAKGMKIDDSYLNYLMENENPALNFAEAQATAKRIFLKILDA